jgi:hypothetical protein
MEVPRMGPSRRQTKYDHLRVKVPCCRLKRRSIRKFNAQNELQRDPVLLPRLLQVTRRIPLVLLSGLSLVRTLG